MRFASTSGMGLIKSIFLLLFITILSSLPADAKASPTDYEENGNSEIAHRLAVEEARKGNLHESLKILEKLYQHDQKNKSVLYDYIVVLAWNHQYARALQLAEPLQPHSTPVYVAVQVAKAARERQDVETSIKWYKSALTKSNYSSVRAILGLALAYTDAGAFDKALEVLAHLDPSERKGIDAVIVQAYIASKKGGDIKAVDLYNQAIAIDANNKEAIRGKVFSLRRLGLSLLALPVMEEHIQYFSPSEIHDVKLDIAASYIRWGKLQEGKKGKDQHKDIDLAVHSLYESLRLFPPGSNEYSRTRFDLIVALVVQRNYQAAISVYENPRLPSPEVPVYVLESVLTAYYQARQPEKAKDISQMLLGKDPNNYHAKVTRIYILLDLLEYDKAIAGADELLKNQPEWITNPVSKLRRQNPRKVEALILSALTRSQAGNLKSAQEILEQALSVAPNNTDIRHELGQIYASRMWLDKSLSEYSQIVAIEPDLLSARIGFSHALLDRGMYEKAEEEMEYISEHYETNRNLSALNKRWQNHNKREFITSASAGNSTGGGPQGQSEYRADAFLYSQPLEYRYRAFVHSFNASSNFEEGNGDRYRTGAGLEYRGRDWISSFELSASLTDDPDIGGSLDALYRINDNWNVEGSLQVDTNQVPLQAALFDVSANLLSVGAQFNASEEWGAGGAVNALDFDDGNKRQILLVSGNRQIINRPRYQGFLIAEGSGSHNSKQDVPYFSPQYDASFLMGIDNLWTSYQRFEHVFQQRITLSAGVYDQQDFDTDFIGNAQYQHIVGIEIRRAQP
jgi:biofilm PGA synthesis protein PgaA